MPKRVGTRQKAERQPQPESLAPTLVGASTDLTPPPPVSGPVPERIGRYRIVRLLGQGGMGAVYLAEDTQLQREVALKVPRFSVDVPPAVLERFYREARTAARLQHPNLCPVYDVDEIDGIHYLTMAYIDGPTLAKLVPDFAERPPRDVAVLVRTLALALDEAHRQGIVHRDLKPSNIMIDRRGEPVVMDFGLAREIHASSSDLSLPGVIVGTPAYMAPEQARGDLAAVGPGCDIYSLGVILYQLLLGRLPFEGTTMEVLAQHLRDEPPPPSQVRPDIDAALEAICLRAMAKEPGERFLCMGDFAGNLEEYLRAPAGKRAALPAGTGEPLQRVVAEILVQFRTWGWEVGIGRIPARLAEVAGEGIEELPLLLRWMQGDRSAVDEAEARFRHSRQYPALAGWALAGQVFLANRDHLFGRVRELLKRGGDRADRRDNILQAELALQRGFFLNHGGKPDDAAESLHAALDLCGRDHYLTGPILSLLGVVYARLNNLLAARECLEQARSCMERFARSEQALGMGPTGGANRALARTYRQLGQLYLDWGQLDASEDAFRMSLEIAIKCEDERSQANAFHYLGRLLLVRGNVDAAAGTIGSARRCWARAIEWIDASIRSNAMTGGSMQEAYARRDRALACLTQGDYAGATGHLDAAESTFRAGDHADGMARVQLVRGILAREQHDFLTSKRLLRTALQHFDRTSDFLEAANTQHEIARTLAAAHDVGPMIVHEYLAALRRAEVCRRTWLVRRVEEELRAIDEDAWGRHVLRRSRGQGATVDTSSLDEGISETATVLTLDLRGFLAFCQGLDPSEVMRTVNQMMTDLTEMLEHHRGFVTSYLGGGFVALLRGSGHAERAVLAALEMLAAVNAFNRPRAALGLRQLPVRIGIASGNVFLGNIGTYHKMDFSAIGPPVNLASRLMRDPASPGVCISHETHERVRGRFEFGPDNPRVLDLTGIGRREVWDVLGRKQGPAQA